MHATEELPYIIGCFKGTPSNDMQMTIASLCLVPSKLASLLLNK